MEKERKSQKEIVLCSIVPKNKLNFFPNFCPRGTLILLIQALFRSEIRVFSNRFLGELKTQQLSFEIT